MPARSQQRSVREDERRREDEVGARAEWGRREHGYDPEKKRAQRVASGTRMPHTCPPQCIFLYLQYFLWMRAESVSVLFRPEGDEGKGKICELHRVVVHNPRNIRIAIPRNVRPVVFCRLNICFSGIMMGTFRMSNRGCQGPNESLPVRYHPVVSECYEFMGNAT